MVSMILTLIFRGPDLRSTGKSSSWAPAGAALKSSLKLCGGKSGQRQSGYRFKDAQRALFRLHRRTDRHKESLLERILAGNYRVGNRVGQRNPGRAGRELEGLLRAIALKFMIV